MRKNNKLSEEEKSLISHVNNMRVIAYPLIKTYMYEYFGVTDRKSIERMLNRLVNNGSIVLMKHQGGNKILMVFSTKWYNKNLKPFWLGDEVVTVE